MLAVLAGAAACSTQHTALTPVDLARQAGPLLAEGSAEVAGAGGSVRVSADELVDVRVREGELERPVRLTVRELVAGCAGGLGAPGCLAARAAVEPALERRQLRFDRERTATALGLGLIGGAVGLCLVACAGDADADVGRGVVITGGVALGAVALFLLAASLGH